MFDDVTDAPEPIDQLASRCVAHVEARLDFTLDYTEETLGVLDHFLRTVLADEGEGEVPPPGHSRRAHLVHLLAPTVGAYFGEVLRRVFRCRWRLGSEEPASWALEFEHVPLRFNPIGAAAEALFEGPIEEWSAALATAPDEREPLFERLAASPPVPEDQFYALTTRHEVLQISEDWLATRLAAEGDVDPDAVLSRDYYDSVLGPVGGG